MHRVNSLVENERRTPTSGRFIPVLPKQLLVPYAIWWGSSHVIAQALALNDQSLALTVSRQALGAPLQFLVALRCLRAKLMSTDLSAACRGQATYVGATGNLTAILIWPHTVLCPLAL